MSLARNLSKFKPSSSGLVETADIADDAVTTAKVNADAIGTTELANDVAITTSGAVSFTGTVAGTAMTLLNTTTASNVANVTFSSSLITDTYMFYRIMYSAVLPVTNAQKLFLYASIDNGSNYNLPVEQILMYHDLKSVSDNGVASSSDTNNRFNLNSSIGNSSSKGTNGTVELLGLRNDNASFKGAVWDSVCGISSDSGHTSGNDYWWNGGGKIITASKVNNIKLEFASGNVSQGTFSLYGIKS